MFHAPVRLSRLLPLAVAGGVLLMTAGAPQPAFARGPDGIADVAEWREPFVVQAFEMNHGHQ